MVRRGSLARGPGDGEPRGPDPPAQGRGAGGHHPPPPDPHRHRTGARLGEKPPQDRGPDRAAKRRAPTGCHLPLHAPDDLQHLRHRSFVDAGKAARLGFTEKWSVNPNNLALLTSSWSRARAVAPTPGPVIIT